MNKRNKRILLAVLGASVSTMFLVKTLAPAKADQEMVQVIQVKTKDIIHKGDSISQDELGTDFISKSEYHPWMVTRMGDAVGNYAATDLLPGDILRTERISKKQVEDFKPDDRTINLEMDLPKLGGLPHEGDRADVIAYFPPPDKSVGVVGRSELVLQNVYIDKIITKDWKEVQQSASAADDKKNQNDKSSVPAIVTLKVSVQDSLVLTTLQSNKDLVLRLVGRTDNSKDVQAKSMVSDQLRSTEQVR